MNLTVAKKHHYLLFSLLLLSAALFTGFHETDSEVEASFENQDTELFLEIADTPKEREVGLMNRTTLSEDRGMLFVYEEEAPRSFWMKNTLIPLDIIFLDSNKTVINIEKGFPEPNTLDSELKRYSSESPAKYVIEVNQNFTERNEIGKGDRVEFTLSR